MKTETVITKTHVSFSFPIVAMLGILFVALKLCGVIAWPWLWVLAPFWIPMAVVLAVVAGIVLIPLAIFGLIGLFALAKTLFRKP